MTGFSAFAALSGTVIGESESPDIEQVEGGEADLAPAIDNPTPMPALPQARSPGAELLHAMMAKKPVNQSPAENADDKEGHEWGCIGLPPHLRQKTGELASVTPIDAARKPPAFLDSQVVTDAAALPKNALLAQMHRKSDQDQVLWFFKPEDDKPAFSDLGAELAFASVASSGVDREAIKMGLLLALERGWAPPHLEGSPGFRQKAFQEAARMNIPVTGYSPSPQEIKFLEKEGVKVTLLTAAPTVPAKAPKTAGMECG